MLALIAGIFSTVCFFVIPGVTGLAAIVLGFVAISEVKRSDGRFHGDGAAVTGIVLGGLHVVGVAVGFALYIAAFATALKAPHASSPGVTPAPVVPTPTPTPAQPFANPEEPGGRTPDAAMRVTKFGKVTLVDPAPGSGSLETLLREERVRADAASEKLLVWLSSPELAPCTGVSVALRDARLQRALAGARILRLDVNEYYVELTRLGFPVKVLPGFVLTSPEGRPLDYVSGGEWDADVPENIAPVLGNFIQGRYVRRRNPWHGPERGDETKL
jgi:hypothetical protein